MLRIMGVLGVLGTLAATVLLDAPLEPQRIIIRNSNDPDNPAAGGYAGTIYFNNNYDSCPDWTENGIPGDASVCGVNDEISTDRNQATYNGARERIYAHPDCRSGKCQVHTRADGDDANTGGVKYIIANLAGLSGGVTALYGCYWSRFENGQSWRNDSDGIGGLPGTLTGRTPIYTKELYINPGNVLFSFTVGFHSLTWGMQTAATPVIGSPANSAGWTSLFGAGNVSNNNIFHQFEFYMTQGAGGARRSWIDGVQVENATANWGSGDTIREVVVGHNEGWQDNDANPVTDAGPDRYVIFDDVFFGSVRPASGQSAGVCGTVS